MDHDCYAEDTKCVDKRAEILCEKIKQSNLKIQKTQKNYFNDLNYALNYWLKNILNQIFSGTCFTCM